MFEGVLGGRRVAIKKLVTDPNQRSVPQNKLAELRREIRGLRKLRHPRLVEFLGAALEPPHLCIITELLTGGSVEQLLQKGRARCGARPSLARVIGMVLQLFEGVAFMHQQSPVQIHRDLKPMNLLLDDCMNLKICDLGLVSAMEHTHLSIGSKIAGSPRYMAPEQFEPGEKRITEKVDIWACGCILIELFGGPPPHEDCRRVEQLILKLVVHRSPPSVPSYIPKRAQSLARACLEFSPSNRVSADQLLVKVADWNAQIPKLPERLQPRR